MQSVQVKLCYPLTVHAIPERLRDVSCGGAIQIDYLYLYLYDQNVKPFWVILQQEMADVVVVTKSGRQVYHLHSQITTNNQHCVLQAGCTSCHPTNSVK